MEREKIRIALLAKGFVEAGGDHDFYHLQVGGKKASVFTKLSRGTKHRDLGDDLVGKMARQIGLTQKEFTQFVDCSLTQESHLTKLRERNRVR